MAATTALTVFALVGAATGPAVVQAAPNGDTSCGATGLALLQRSQLQQKSLVATLPEVMAVFGFAPVDGGDNRACRGASPGDNSQSYYMVYSNAEDLEDCKKKCSVASVCKGIEYRVGRCEVWTRPGGISVSVERTGYTCLSYGLQDFIPVANASNSACRGEDSGDSKPEYYTVSFASSLDVCKASCRSNPQCQGVEYGSGGRCEVWTRAAGIEATAPRTGYVCLHYLGAASAATTAAPRTAMPRGNASAARDAQFLIQATFGPTRASLRALGHTTYQGWILQQMALPVESHREYYRRRANPRVLGGGPEGVASGSPRPRCRSGSRWLGFALHRWDEGRAVQVRSGKLLVEGQLRTEIDPTHAGNGQFAPAACSDRAPEDWQSRGQTCKSEARSASRNCMSEVWREAKLCEQTCFDEGYGHPGTDCSGGWAALTSYDGYICNVKQDAVGAWVRLSSASSCQSELRAMPNPAVWLADPSAAAAHSSLRFEVFQPDVLLLAETLSHCNLGTFLRSDAEGHERFYVLEPRLELAENTPSSPASMGSWPGGRCPGVPRSFLNEGSCRLLPGCLPLGTSTVKVPLSVASLRQFHETGGRYVFAATGLRPTAPPCGGLTRWRQLDCTTETCVASGLSPEDEAALRAALQTAESEGWLRDVVVSCTAVPTAAVVQVGEAFFKHTHLHEYNVYDFTDWVEGHPGGPDKIRQWVERGYLLEFPSWHDMERWDKGTAPGILGPNLVGRYLSSVDFQSLPQPLRTQELAEALGASASTAGMEHSIVCGSPGEVANDPALGHQLSFHHGGEHDWRFDPDYEQGWGMDRLSRSAVWTMRALFAEDQLRQRMAWALSQIFVLGGSTGGHTEMWLNFYDIFVRNAFGNFRDVLREVTYSPMMGDYLTYRRNRAFDSGGNFPDENYAREIMQLFTIGLWKLNADGSRAKDVEGQDIPTYSNEHIMNFARVFTGFDEQQDRANYEHSGGRNQIDPMRMQTSWHDAYPKPDLDGGFLGDGYPLCSDLPADGFLQRGARYSFLGHGYAGTDVLEVDSASPLHAAICGGTAVGGCSHRLTVELPTTLECHGQECEVNTVRVVKVAGGFYEHQPPSCVHFYFFEGRIAAHGGRAFGWQRQCKNPDMPAAGTACCGGCKNERDGWMRRRSCSCENATDVCPDMYSRCELNEWWRERKYCQLACWQAGAGYAGDNCSSGPWRGARGCGYHGERVQLAVAEARCAKLGLQICGEKLEGYGCGYDSTHVWTREPCSYEVIVYSDGKVSSNLTAQTRQNRFAVPWRDDRFPTMEAGACPSGCRAVGHACSCAMQVETRAVFAHTPRPQELLARLHIGALRPAGPCTANCSGEVRAYSPKHSVDKNSVFEYRGRFFKNQEATVTLGSFSFRNPPAFVSSEEPSSREALAEVESLLEHLFRHENTPVFVSHRLIQRLVSSNPSPGYIRDVAEAFRSGRYVGIVYSGSYGDLAATVAAILLHPEAQGQAQGATASPASAGTLREPLLKLVHFMRSMDYRDEAGRAIVLENLLDRIGQWPFSAPTVFNFYLPDFQPDAFPAGLAGPEFQIFTPPLAIGFINGLTSLIDHGLGHCDGGLGTWSRECSHGRVHLRESECLHQTLEELDLLLTGGRLGTKGQELLRVAYEAAEGGDQFKAVQQAAVMTAEFHTLGAPQPQGPRAPQPPRPVNEARSYRAMVMVFLHGGADTFNMLVPLDCPLYDEYRQVRKNVALLPGQLHRIATAGQPCASFGVHSQLPFVKELYDLGEAAFVSNVGSLVEPLTSEQFFGGGARCAGLFSHSDQQQAAQTLKCQTATATSKGAGGRIADALASGSQGFRTMSFSVAGSSTWSQGFETSQEVLDRHAGAVRFERREQLRGVVENVTGVRHGNIYCEEYAQQLGQAVKFNEELEQQLRGAELKTMYLTENEDLSMQLKQVARLIAARDARQAERDFFFVSLGGFDTHQSVTRALDERFQQVNNALRAFVGELKAQDVFKDTVLVTHSDFGRTLTPNGGDGTDHAWAGNHLVMGGAVRGGRVFNDFPTSLLEGSEQDAGRGRLIPKHPWESVILPVAQWLGLEEAQHGEVFPNIANFNASRHLISRASLFKT